MLHELETLIPGVTFDCLRADGEPSGVAARLRDSIREYDGLTGIFITDHNPPAPPAFETEEDRLRRSISCAVIGWDGLAVHLMVGVTGTGIAAGLYRLLKLWVDTQNGRKLKIKVGDIEVEATQMKEADVLRIFELLEEKADRKKIRELLTSATSKGEGRPNV